MNKRWEIVDDKGEYQIINCDCIDFLQGVCGTFKERIPEFPTQLPLKLLRPIIAFASNPGDVVLDPFNGSGTTGMVCIEKDRLYTGIELSEKFFDLSVDRLAKAFKEKKLARQAIVPDVPSVVA